MTTAPSTSAPTAFSVPVIDLSPYPAGEDPAGREFVAREIDAACSQVGFMQIVGNGIDDAVIDGLAGAMDDFFALPPETKNGYRVVGANRGCSPPKSETPSLSLGVEARSLPDLALDEADYGINLWPHCRDFSRQGRANTGAVREAARVLAAAQQDRG